MLPGKHLFGLARTASPPSAGGTLPNAAKFAPYDPERIKLGDHSFGTNKALILGRYSRNTFFAFGCCKHAARTVRCSAVEAACVQPSCEDDHSAPTRRTVSAGIMASGRSARPAVI